MVKLSDLIHIHENSLEENICDELVSFFELNSDEHEILDNNGTPNFTQLNITKNRSKIEKVHDHIIKKVFKYRDKYYNYVHKNVFPESHAFEEFRIKRYNTGGNDRFDTHVDVKEYPTARRFLSFFWYLNDVEKGGTTTFLYKEDDVVGSVEAKQGRCLVFPPTWTYPHKGDAPMSSPKYIVGSYLHIKGD